VEVFITDQKVTDDFISIHINMGCAEEAGLWKEY